MHLTKELRSKLGKLRVNITEIFTSAATVISKSYRIEQKLLISHIPATPATIWNQFSE
jgi:hypothetical protein